MQIALVRPVSPRPALMPAPVERAARAAAERLPAPADWEIVLDAEVLDDETLAPRPVDGSLAWQRALEVYAAAGRPARRRHLSILA